MATINRRLSRGRITTVNGIDVGGMMSARIQKGYDEIITSAPDNLAVPLRDRGEQFCRGRIATQAWSLLIDLLTAVSGTYVFYERESGAATYTKHTLSGLVVHGVSIQMRKGGYADLAIDFECRAADETKGFADMHTLQRGQSAPVSWVNAARGGWRIESALHGSTNIYHVLSFSFGIKVPVSMQCNDGDVGYTCVDADQEAMAVAGAISFEDTGAGSVLLVDTLLGAAASDLVLVVRQAAGAADKTVTIANAVFETGDYNGAAGQTYSSSSASFSVANSLAQPLTLAGANKIITIG